MLRVDVGWIAELYIGPTSNSVDVLNNGAVILRLFKS